MIHILVVDDDKNLNQTVCTYLNDCGFEAKGVLSATEAYDEMYNNLYELIISDIMMPEIDGLKLCQIIREQYNYPIIMLTAKSTELDKINGLMLGADDYLTKPFLPLELVARVKAQLRRYTRYNVGAEQNQDIFIHHGLVLNRKTHECTLNEKPLSLTPTEFEILAILCEKKGSVVSSEELFHQIWKDEYYSKNNNTITVHIRHLREKMQDSFEKPKYIKTVWGCGYKIEN